FMGYLHVKDVLDLTEHDRAVPQHLWRSMTTLRAELPLDDALAAMRGAASHLAAVADASGRVLGLAALEDVLEMLVGEVHDPAHEAAGGPPRQRTRAAAPEPGAQAHNGDPDSAAGEGTSADSVDPSVTGAEEAADQRGDRQGPDRTAPHRTPA
ncbi:MAG TPA: hypothetical protein VGO89_14120, partial [Streptomyces sp.]|nr:hypothetical protein [Streptomyces sp.]